MNNSSQSPSLQSLVQYVNLEHILSYEKFMDEGQGPTSILAQFFRKKEMKKIVLTKTFMKVQFAYRRPIQKVLKQSAEKSRSGESIMPSTSKMVILTEQLREVLPDLLLNLKAKKSDNSSNQIQFQKWLETKSGNIPFWSMFFSIGNEGPNLKYFVFSKKLLQILGYQMEQAALYFRKYKQIAISFIGDQTLKQVVFSLLTMLKQLGYYAKNQEFTDENLNLVAQKYVVQGSDTLFGKDDLKVNAEIKGVFRKPYMLHTQLTKIFSKQREVTNQINKKQRQFFEIQHAAKLYHSLSSIFQLPKQMNPIYQSKICSYIQLINKDSVKKENNK